MVTLCCLIVGVVIFPGASKQFEGQPRRSLGGAEAGVEVLS